MDRRTVVKALGTGSFSGMTGLAGCIGGDDGNGEEGGNGGNSNPTSYDWIMGTSGEETGTHAAGVAMSNIVSENSDIFEMSAQTTGGTVTNIRLVDQNEIDIGMTATSLLWMANQGVSPYHDPPLDATMTQLFSYFTANIFVMKRNIESLDGVTKLADLPDGTSISLGPRGTSTWDPIRFGLEVLGIDYQEKFDVKPINYSDQPAAMNEGRVDACVGYTINDIVLGWLQELDSTVEFSVLDWGITEEQASEADAPLTLNTDMSADLFSQDVGMDPFTAVTLGYSHVLPAETETEPAYEFVKQLMENHEQVREAHAVLRKHGPEFATEWLLPDGVPVHPGAEKYYKEIGVWNDDLTTLEEYEG